MPKNQKKRPIWRKYDDAHAFALSLNLLNKRAWQDFCRSGQLPDDIPVAPHLVYREQFRGYGDWLGTGRMASRNRLYRRFDDARAFVRSLRLPNVQAWQDFCRSGQLPDDIPTTPHKTYREQFQGYGDWLGTGNVWTGNRSYRRFDDAHAFALSLNLPNKRAWQDFCRSGQLPDDIPATPDLVYREQFRGYGDWLGTINKWSRKGLLAFLEHLRQHLHTLPEQDLFMILQQEKVFPALCKTLGQASTLQTLRKLIDQGNQENVNQALISLAEQVCEFDDRVIPPDNLRANAEAASFLTHLFDQQGSTEVNRNTSLLRAEGESSLTREHLHNIDQLSLPVELDSEVADYLVTKRVSQLWEDYSHNGWQAVESLLAGEGGPVFTAIKNRFLREVKAVEELTLPEGWSFLDRDGCLASPNLMQRRTAWEIRERRRVGNWSGTGSGKTLAAILASRVIAAHITLIVTNYSSVEGWCTHIRSAYPDSIIITTLDRICTIHDDSSYYIVLNYEKLQKDEEFYQKEGRTSPVQQLLHLRLDFVVLDEIQLVKQRDNNDREASNRRKALKDLIYQATEYNPDLCVLGMSATPVINNLYEGKKLLEIIAGRTFPELDAKHQTVNNALCLHRALMRHGLRFRPHYEQTMEIQTVSIIQNDLQEIVKEAQTTILQVEQALLPAKLEGISAYVQPGTLIYTHYVDGMIAPTCACIKTLGLSVGLYTGSDKSGLEGFLHGTVDVLVGSSPVGTGLDGLQSVCQKIIFLSLPWTGAEFEQIIGRVYRQGSRFEKVEVIIPQVIFHAEENVWSWDKMRMEVIAAKRTLSDCILDGKIPQALSINKQALLHASQQALEQWITRVKQKKEEE
jgi:hypothetical protein